MFPSRSATRTWTARELCAKRSTAPPRRSSAGSHRPQLTRRSSTTPPRRRRRSPAWTVASCRWPPPGRSRRPAPSARSRAMPSACSPARMPGAYGSARALSAACCSWISAAPAVAAGVPATPAVARHAPPPTGTGGPIRPETEITGMAPRCGRASCTAARRPWMTPAIWPGRYSSRGRGGGRHRRPSPSSAPGGKEFSGGT